MLRLKAQFTQCDRVCPFKVKPDVHVRLRLQFHFLPQCGAVCISTNQHFIGANESFFIWNLFGSQLNYVSPHEVIALLMLMPCDGKQEALNTSLVKTDLSSHSCQRPEGPAGGKPAPCQTSAALETTTLLSRSYASLRGEVCTVFYLFDFSQLILSLATAALLLLRTSLDFSSPLKLIWQTANRVSHRWNFPPWRRSVVLGGKGERTQTFLKCLHLLRDAGVQKASLNLGVNQPSHGELWTCVSFS